MADTQAITVFATADVHLGMKFSAYDAAGENLADARYEALSRCVDEANRRNADLFIIAGDLFDRVRVARPVVERAASILAEFEGAAALVLPGNHDYVRSGVESLWSIFRDVAGGRTIVLREPRVYDLRNYELPVEVYPAPCDAKHSPRHGLDWIAASGSEALKIGVAHGSIEGRTLDSEGRYFPMTVKELADTGLDAWIVGHTHVQYFHPEVGLVIPGTPEPDGFDCSHDGYAAVLRVDEGVHLETVPTGRYRFRELSVTLDPESSVESQLLPQDGDSGVRTVARLIVSGTVPGDVHDEYLEVARRLPMRYLAVDIRDGELRRSLSRDDVDRMYPEQSFPHRLLVDLLDAQAADALEEARRLLEEAEE